MTSVYRVGYSNVKSVASVCKTKTKLADGFSLKLANANVS